MKQILIILLALTGYLSLQAQSAEFRYFAHDNTIREYWLYVPLTYTPEKPASVVFVLHGFGSNGESMQGVGFNDYADEHNYIMVYPQAALTELSYAWNCGIILSQNIDDVGFLTELLDELSVEFNINPQRVYSCGFSLGGMMSYRLACEKSDRFTAVASVGAPFSTSIGNSCNPERAVPVLYFHGTEDQVLPYGGSIVVGSTSGNFTLNRWANINGCVDTILTENLNNSDQDYPVERKSASDCIANSEIIHYKIYNWPHSWPRTQTIINATAEIVDFFEKHDTIQYELATPILNNITTSSLKLYPNPFKEKLAIDFEENKQYNWTLSTLNGETVRKGSNSVLIDTDAVESGIYLFQLQTKSGLLTKKIIKQ